MFPHKVVLDIPTLREANDGVVYGVYVREIDTWLNDNIPCSCTDDMPTGNDTYQPYRTRCCVHREWDRSQREYRLCYSFRDEEIAAVFKLRWS